MKNAILKEEYIAEKILFLRNEKVMLDSDLAVIYETETKYVNRAVKRNLNRFPPDFMFQLSEDEWKNLKFQIGTSRWGGRRTPPFAFTEYGAIMLATVLNSPRAIETSILVVRAFVKLREFVMLSKEITGKLNEFEVKTNKKLTDHDKMFQVVFDTLKKVMTQESKPKRPIGFLTD